MTDRDVLTPRERVWSILYDRLGYDETRDLLRAFEREIREGVTPTTPDTGTTLLGPLRRHRWRL